MTKFRFSVFAVVSIALTMVSTGAAVAQSPIATWTFETSLPTGTGTTNGPYAADVGSGSASGVHALPATVWSSPAGNGSLHSFSSNTWSPGDYYQFQVSTTGVTTGINVNFDQTRSATGPAAFALQYSTNGTTFTNFSNYTVAAISWSTTTANPASTSTFDLSAIAVLNNQATVFFRLVDVELSASAAGGTNRVDNFSLSVAPVPEQGTVMAFAAGVLGFGNFIRRKVRRA